MILFSGIKFTKISGIALWPFVFTKPKWPNETLLNHEKIHLRQQKEMLLVFFYVWYLTEWAIRYLKTKDFDKAYRSICFEKEAFSNENDLTYLQKRKVWSFLKYL